MRGSRTVIGGFQSAALENGIATKSKPSVLGVDRYLKGSVKTLKLDLDSSGFKTLEKKLESLLEAYNMGIFCRKALNVDSSILR